MPLILSEQGVILGFALINLFPTWYHSSPCLISQGDNLSYLEESSKMEGFSLKQGQVS